MAKGMLKCVCLQCESKGASRSSGTTLNSHRERGRRGEEGGSCDGRRLPLMAAASRARAEEKGNGRFETRVNAALIGRLKRGGKEGKVAGAAGITAAPGLARQRRGRRRKEGEGGAADQWGRDVSETKKKEIKRRWCGLLRGRG
jgi:hypothetical protein